MSAEAMQALTFEAITRRETTGGAAMDDLASAVRDATGEATACKVAAECLEALQADGAVYEREGRYFPL